MKQYEKQGRIVFGFQHFKKGWKAGLGIKNCKGFIHCDVPFSQEKDLQDKIKKNQPHRDQPGF
jgi:hypothetical protein